MKSGQEGQVLHIAAQMTSIWAQKQQRLSTQDLAKAFQSLYDVVSAKIRGEDAQIELEALRKEGFEPIGGERVQLSHRQLNVASPNFGKPLEMLTDLSHLKSNEEVCPGGI